MRESAYGRGHKAIVRKRMDEVLLHIILPMAPPSDGITHFTVQEDESLHSIVNQLKRDCPKWCRNRAALLLRLGVLLEEAGDG